MSAPTKTAPQPAARAAKPTAPTSAPSAPPASPHASTPTPSPTSSASTSVAANGAATPAVVSAPIVNDPVLLTVRRRITADDYHAMADVGLIGPDERTELLDGEVVTKMTSNSLHAGCVNRLNGLLGALLAGSAIVSVQNPVRLDDHSEPEPDIAVLAPRDDFYGRSHAIPTDVFWLAEVADTSRRLDRDVKIPLYSASRIPEVWLVDLATATVEVHRDPDAAGYRLVQRLGRGDVLHPAAFPDLAVAVDAIFGPADDASATTDA